MRKHESHNLETDRIAKRLIGKTMLSEGEIDKMIASPVLYSSIRNRVNATPVEVERLGWFRVPAAAAFASLLAVVGISAFAFFGKSGTPLQAKRVLPNREVAQPATRSSEPDGFSDRLSEPAAIERPQIIRRRFKMLFIANRWRRVFELKAPRLKQNRELEFIPLLYTGDPNESVSGGRVIRVEMSRASLFAMGVNMPIENGIELVKADLLVGQDGVPRAIRMPQ